MQICYTEIPVQACQDNSFAGNRMISLETVDFSCLSLNIPHGELKYDVIDDTAQKLVNCFQSYGFVKLTNTGFDFDLINESFDKANEFFSLRSDVKQKYSRVGSAGYVEIGRESLDDERKQGGLKESYNITAEMYTKQQYPTEVSAFDEVSNKLFGACENLARRIFLALAVGLKLENSEFFVENFNIGRKENDTTLRYLYYPPLEHEYEEGEVRLGEHTDFGCFTLNFPKSGATPLQAKTPGGKWVEVEHTPGVVLVHTADLLQIWTSDTILAMPHRILAPVNEKDRHRSRDSIVFFVHPDTNTLVECLDGTKKYPPITAGEHLQNRYKTAYK